MPSKDEEASFYNLANSPHTLAASRPSSDLLRVLFDGDGKAMLKVGKGCATRLRKSRSSHSKAGRMQINKDSQDSQPTQRSWLSDGAFLSGNKQAQY